MAAQHPRPPQAARGGWPGRLSGRDQYQRIVFERLVLPIFQKEAWQIRGRMARHATADRRSGRRRAPDRYHGHLGTANGPPLPVKHYFPYLVTEGDEIVRAIASES